MEWNRGALNTIINDVLEASDWDATMREVLDDLAKAIIHEFNLVNNKYDVHSCSITIYDVDNPIPGYARYNSLLSDAAHRQSGIKDYTLEWNSGWDHYSQGSVHFDAVKEHSRLVIFLWPDSLSR